MSVELIFKTTSPDAIAFWEAAIDARENDRVARLEYLTRMTEEFGQLQPADAGGEPSLRELWLRGDRPDGLACAPGEQPPAGSGWRLDANDGYWKPKLTTKKGKERAAELASLLTFSVRDKMGDIGVPQVIFADHRMFSPGVRFDEDERAIYVTWSSAACRDEAVAVQSKLPNIDWVEVPRSVWFAQVEAREAAA